MKSSNKKKLKKVIKRAHRLFDQIKEEEKFYQHEKYKEEM